MIRVIHNLARIMDIQEKYSNRVKDNLSIKIGCRLNERHHITAK